MTILVQCCSLSVLLLLLYFYKTQKHLNLRTERAYWRLFCASFVSTALDIISCVFIFNTDTLPLTAVNISAKLYLLSILALTGFLLQYIGADIYLAKGQYRKMLFRYYICASIGAAVVLCLPISYKTNTETKKLYSYGPAVFATYVFSGIVIVITLIQIARNKNKIMKNRRDGVIITFLIIFTFGIIQFFYKDVLLISFAFATGMVVLYLKLENPGYNLDTHTGLFNQNAFNLYAAQLYGSTNDFSVIEIICDFNNSVDEQSNDLLMTEVANYLNVFPKIISFKDAGSEILIIVDDSESADSVLEQLRERFKEPWGEKKDIYLSPRWIYVPNPHIVRSREELVGMLRYVRQHNPDYLTRRFVIADENTAEIISEDKQVSELILGALADDRVEVFYQPIFSTHEHKFTAAEALVRLRDEDGNIVPPGRFIGVAESNGLIMKLGEAVFRKVCRFLSEHDLRALGLKYIEVNLSVIQCAYENLADDYIRIMEQHNISPDMINLEITESASVETKNVLLNNMQKLMDFGVNFSLDDFGTGQSNLNYIIDMPVEIVKFDREMTNAYFENSKAKYIMDAAMNMIHGMDLSIVSEGVETKEQLQTMIELNISYIQGYYFSKPLPAEEFLSFLAQNNLEKIRGI